jgi:hypothetical protein
MGLWLCFMCLQIGTLVSMKMNDVANNVGRNHGNNVVIPIHHNGYNNLPQVAEGQALQGVEVRAVVMMVAEEPQLAEERV